MSKCTSCQGPTSANDLACSYCGVSLRVPADINEELLLVQQQAAFASSIASQASGVLSASNSENMALFWGSAFVPSTVPALVAAITICSSALPGAEVEHKTRALLGALTSRIEILARAIETHPSATERDRGIASHARNMAASAGAAANQRRTRILMVLLGLLVLPPFLLIPLVLSVGVQDDSKERECTHGQTIDDRIVACSKLCDMSKKWACEMAEQAKLDKAKERSLPSHSQ